MAASAARPWSTLYDTFAALVRVQTQVWNEVDRQVRTAGGPSLAQVSVLQLVASTPGCRVSDVVEAMHITVGGASKVVDRLVAGGHLARRAHPSDGRSSVLEVTGVGSELLEDLGEVVDEVLRHRLRDPLGDAGLARLDDALRTVADARTSTGEARR